MFSCTAGMGLKSYGGGGDSRCVVRTSELDFAGDVLLELSPQLRIILKVVEMMFHPLAENIENPARQRLYQPTNKHV